MPQDKPASTRDWLRRYESGLERGESLSPEEFLSCHPDAKPGLLKALKAIRALREATSDDVGESFGPYRIEREIGRGAQGTVYAAEDTRLARRVALKILNPGRRDVGEFYLRFLREAEGAGRLSHPNICAVFEAGVEHGRPFIAMQFVEGATLSVRIAEGPSTTRSDRSDRVVLIEKVARAIHHAHEHGLVHRDIKPGNIMVTPGGEPVVCDFGLAHLDDDDGTQLTRAGDVRGTPAYMAPEQITGSGTPDARTDVHALGVVLYEYLSGSRPYVGATWALLVSNIIAATPQRPAGIKGPLWIILQTALAHDPARRYATALDLAEDLLCFREHRPIHARRPSPVTRLARLVRRNRVASAAALVLFAGSITFGLSQAAVAQRERQAVVEVERERARSNQRAYASRIAAAGAYVQAHRTRDAHIELSACDENMRGWEWDYLQHATDDADAVWAVSLGSPIGSIVVAADDSYRAVMTRQRIYKFKDFESAPTPVKVSYPFARMAMSPLGSRLAAGTKDGVEIFDPQTLKRTHSLAMHATPSRGLVFLGEDMIASADEHGTTTAVHIADGVLLGRPFVVGERVTTLVAVPGTEELIVGTASGRVIRFDPKSGVRTVLANLPRQVECLAVQDDELLVGCEGGGACVLVLRTGEKRIDLLGHQETVRGVCFFSGGYATVSNDDSTLRTWSPTGEMLTVRVGHEGFRCLTQVGDDLLTGGGQGTVRLYRSEHRPASFREWPVGANIEAVGIHPSGHDVALGGEDGRIRIFDVASRLFTRTLEGIDGAVLAVEYSPDGRWLAAAGDGRFVQLFDTRTYERVALLGGAARDVVAMAWRSDSLELAAATERGIIHIFDVARRRQVSVLGMDMETTDLAWHPDGDHILLASPPRGALIYRRSDGALIRSYPSKYPRQVTSVDVSPDGARFLMSVGGGVQIRDFKTGASLALNRDQSRLVVRARYGPRGRRIATSDTNSILHIRDAESAETLLILTGVAGRDLAWSEDGCRLACVLGARGLGCLGISETRRPPRHDVDAVALAGDRASRALEAPRATDTRLRGKTLDAGLSPEAYRDVLAEVQAAVEKAPHAVLLGSLLAGAHYRCGNYEQALRLLRRASCNAVRTSQWRDERIGLWHAMTLSRLGATSQAREVLADALEALRKADPMVRRELAPLAAEARALIAP